ncbi:hypothetical protein BRE01_59250 [Brevibacillus reuszeri]|uniref:Flagellar hook-associated protein 2 n=1 Tax=Brevibacillus reuszeri TaxID=54915 RepID=A0A0K9YU58_9BACL|nr:flagellar filament capping protein FliD [Brevibacillus reuszeri]KNB72182.1 hypothetical protein ADS79_09680 [Brevibacillus reuszeri]MED1855811.1 flagellar filament capping protein FliD [Brevibacillus reuszeri]GED72223.1 hypothetical protein BRE01_59250 [Brevibacillus reuszeri]
MKVSRVSYVPYSQRVGRYQLQMFQAKLNTPVNPISAYNLQPYYARQQQWTTDLSDSLSQLYRYSVDLDQAAKEFDPKRPKSAINRRQIVSSQPELATATVHGDAQPATYRLEIVRLANEQTNAGRLVESTSQTSMEEGFQQFSLMTDQHEELLSFYSSETDTYGQSIARMKEALDQNQSGLMTRIEAFGSMQSLVVSSTKTGAAQAFTLRDLSGNSIISLGMDHIVTHATDASFYVDGTLHTSATNQIRLGDSNVLVSLHDAGTEPIVLTIKPDTERLLQQTRKLVDRFNSMHHFLLRHEDSLEMQKLPTFERIAEAADHNLNRFGISMLPSGELALDEETWLSTVESSFNGFQDAMQGLSVQFREQVLELQSKPFGTFSRYYDEAVSNEPYSVSSISSLQYLQIAKTGLFLNVLW